MKPQQLGLAGLATISLATFGLSTAQAVEPQDLQKADREGRDLVLGLELSNNHIDQGVAVHDDVTARIGGTGRFWDIGLHLDGWLAVDGNDNRSPEPVSTGEMVQFNLRLDYLMEGNFGAYGLVQVLPHYEAVIYPDISGRTRFNWLGADAWYGAPWQEGLEFGLSIDYNVLNDTPGARGVHEWRGAVGTRFIYQDAPFDYSVYGLVHFGNRAYHEFLSGADKQGVTTLNLGGKITHPLLWQEMWTFLKVEGNWWLQRDDRQSLRDAGKEAVEIIISLGLEWRPE